MPPEFNRETVNLAGLQARVSAVPYVPFRIVLSSGKTYDVPTPDHLSISRLLHRISVEYDDGTASYISLVHITAIEPLSPAGKESRAALHSPSFFPVTRYPCT